MAITNAIMQMRRGLEADFDPDKMRPGEWAVSTDKKYVRMCFSPGVCVRMATYEAFEADMSKIQAILSEVQTIEEAVIRINEEVSANADAVVEYTEQAKQYCDEAKQFRDEAETSATNAKASEDKAKVSETNAKISEENARRVAESLPEDYTELSKAFYNTAIKQKAVGDNIHVTDSVEARNVEFGLYGKAEQKQYSGKNLLENTVTSKTVNGITFTVNNDGSVTANGTATGFSMLNQTFTLPKGSYILSGSPSGGSANASYGQYLRKRTADGIKDIGYETGKGLQFELEEETELLLHSPRIASGYTANNLTFYPMVRLASITDSTYEPFTNGPSPNPDYPQEITVSGSDGSVEVVSCGRNILVNKIDGFGYDGFGIITTIESDGGLHVSGTATQNVNIGLRLAKRLYKGDKVRLTIIKNGEYTLGRFRNDDGVYGITYRVCDGKEVTVDIDYADSLTVRVESGTIVDDTYYLMAHYDEGEYHPPLETTSTIPTPDGLCGIKVSSGGNYTDENGQQWICDEIVKYADGSGKRIQRIFDFVLDGTESWTESSATPGIYYTSDKKINGANKKVMPMLCNMYQNTILANENMPDNTIKQGVSANGNTILVYIKDTSFATVDDLKAFLQTNNAKCYCILAEPIITDLSAEEIAAIEKLHTFYPITNISNDADCGMAVTYLADSKNYIDGQLAIQKAQQEAALLNMLLLLPEETQAAMIENDTNNLLNESEV